MTEACDSPAYSELLLNHACLLGFFLDHCLPRIQVIAIVLPKFSMRLCSWLKASSVRGLNSVLPCQIAIINPQSFSQSSFSQIFIFQKNICMSTELVAVHTHRSHTFSGTVYCEVEAWGNFSDPGVQRFTASVMVTRLTSKLTPSLECVLLGLISVSLMVMSPSTVKYLPDDHLFLSLFKQWQRDQQIWPALSTQATQLSESVSWSDRCKSRGALHNDDCAKVGVKPPVVVLGSVTTKPILQWWAWSELLELLVPPGMDIDAGTAWLHEWGSHGWVIKFRSGVQSCHSGTTPRFSVWLFNTGGQTLGLFSQHHLHWGKITINQTWGMTELMKESGNVWSMCSGDEKCLESLQLTYAV